MMVRELRAGSPDGQLMPTYVYIILLLAWLAWSSAFLSRKRATGARQIKKQARWGILLEGVGFALVWQGRFWGRSPVGSPFPQWVYW